MTKNTESSLCCTVCGCDHKQFNLMTEIQLEIISKYLREDGAMEDMNGLWRKTKEYLCENCFKDYAKVLSEFYKVHQKKLK